MSVYSVTPEQSRVTQAERLVPKKGPTSVIWSWFGYKSSDKEQTTISCKVCRRAVIAKGGNTSNLLHHLKSMHAHAHEDLMRAKSSSSTAAALAEHVGRQHNSHSRLRSLLVCLVIKAAKSGSKGTCTSYRHGHGAD